MRHDGTIFKLTQKRILGNLLNLLQDFLVERKQRVVLKEQVCTWGNINAGVPRGSILGPLLFSIYINDLTEGPTTNANLFADDTSLFSVVHDSQISANGLNKDLEIINNWAYQWKIRSSYPEVFLGKGVPKICSKFTGEQPCQSAILTNLQNSFIEIILKHGCSPVNLLHTFRTPFPKNASGELFCIFHICWMSTVVVFCF